MKPREGIEPFKAAGVISAAAPAVVLENPRYPHNIGAAIRACSCFGLKQVWVSGTRAAEMIWEAKRIPREERMKGFRGVDVVLDPTPLVHFPAGATPVVVDLVPGAENIMGFEHPENPIYSLTAPGVGGAVVSTATRPRWVRARQPGSSRRGPPPRRPAP